MSSEHAATEHAHPGPKTYAKIAVILTLVTAIEVWVFYIEAMQPILVPVLIVLSAVKFSLVAMYYMHLKFDHPIFNRWLIGGLALSFAVFIALLALFTFAHPITQA